MNNNRLDRGRMADQGRTVNSFAKQSEKAVDDRAQFMLKSQRL